MRLIVRLAACYSYTCVRLAEVQLLCAVAFEEILSSETTEAFSCLSVACCQQVHAAGQTPLCKASSLLLKSWCLYCCWHAAD